MILHAVEKLERCSPHMVVFIKLNHNGSRTSLSTVWHAYLDACLDGMRYTCLDKAKSWIRWALILVAEMELHADYCVIGGNTVHALQWVSVLTLIYCIPSLSPACSALLVTSLKTLRAIALWSLRAWHRNLDYT